MNTLPFRGAGLVKRLPIYTARTSTIKYILGANLFTFGLYHLSTGPSQLAQQQVLQLGPNSSIVSLLTSHFSYTNPLSLLFHGGILYTIGNYHVLKYGCSHFLTLYGAGLAIGGLLAAYELYSNRNIHHLGGSAGTGALIAYNVMKNPQWFKFGLNPFYLLTAYALYASFYGDRAAFGGLAAGYLSFLFGCL